ncbi:MAG TPA: valine--tRNA ligase [Candidatus Paceibacterota bacterium]|nr:valine--tRNA ligase [Candidatus Paceibacterota bacterium]
MPDNSSSYNPNETEEKIYRLWEESGFFNPDNLPERHQKSFTIIMPPPNANGSLHLGHALTTATEDIMIRYKRMRGFKTLWLPGADHAGFETQVVFEKKLEKEGSSRFEILKQEGGREKLYKMIWDFTQTNKSHMEDQIKKLGASCDWSREKFTLDPNIIKTVYQTFKKMYDDGLIYRASRIVNWCPKHQTALSDLEINWEERNDKIYYVKYFLADNPKEFIIVATTRPETIPGDFAIAVHPQNKQYKNFIGKSVTNPLIKNRGKYGDAIKVISDSAVDKDFGTGALKITPAHDSVDFEIGKNHSLPLDYQIIGWDGRMNELTGELNGLKILEARTKSIEILEKAGALEKIEDYKHQVSVCYKCKNTIEPLPRTQWFVKMTEAPKSGKLSLRDLATEAVKSGKVKFVSKKFEKIFNHWMKNIRDWNISRQIVWGIPIPIWYCAKCGQDILFIENGRPDRCPKCNNNSFKKESDVFDTWFSSGQWPFATLQACRPDDFKRFYPTSIMETGWDILFFWVARMIMFGLYVTGKIPFEHVYLHGLIRDKDRQKMSKSKNNAIDPLGVIDLYGTDALRLALIIGNAPGNDPIISEEKIRGYRNFANKIWNASKFVMMNLEDFAPLSKPTLTDGDKKILKELGKFIKEVTKDMENFRFYAAGEKIYHYFWHTFADKIIESVKPRLKSADKNERLASQYLLLEILKTNLKLLHPFMPFITEEIYQKLPIKEKKLLMIEEWPI